MTQNLELCQLLWETAKITKHGVLEKNKKNKKILDLLLDPDSHQDLMGSLLISTGSFHQILWKSILWFLHNPEDTHKYQSLKMFFFCYSQRRNGKIESWICRFVRVCATIFMNPSQCVNVVVALCSHADRHTKKPTNGQ